MIVTYKPCHTRRPATFSQPAPDQLRVEWRGKTYEVDFSDPGLEYEIPDEARDVVHKAWRDTEDGPLHLVVPSLGRLSQDVTIDHGTEETLGW
jgi:hypothetical protein